LIAKPFYAAITLSPNTDLPDCFFEPQRVDRIDLCRSLGRDVAGKKLHRSYECFSLKGSLRSGELAMWQLFDSGHRNPTTGRIQSIAKSPKHGTTD
jgi:hypothetical protein